MTSADGRPLDAVHLDVSPENILVSVSGAVKLTDFGVARFVTDTTDISQSGAFIRGKAAYMSPEQAAGEGVDRRSDVFSAGCVLYEATTGAAPFTGAKLLDVIRAVLRGRFTPPESLVAGYPPGLARIVECALAPDPEDRFPTAEAMDLALRTWLTTQPTVTDSEIGALVRGRVGKRILANRARMRTV